MEKVVNADPILFGGKRNQANVLLVAGGLKPVTRFLVHRDFVEELQSLLESIGLNVLNTEISTFAYGQCKQLVYISLSFDMCQKAYDSEKSGNHSELGALLGYPSCCINFFDENFEKAKYLHNDFTLLALERSNGMDFASLMNISLRYFDKGVLSHFPCSFDCKCSLELAKRYAEYIGRCAPQLYSAIADDLDTAVIYSNETGVHVFEGVANDKDGFKYRDVKMTSPNYMHDLLVSGDRVKPLDSGGFSVLLGNNTIGQFDGPMVGVMHFHKTYIIPKSPTKQLSSDIIFKKDSSLNNQSREECRT